MCVYVCVWGGGGDKVKRGERRSGMLHLSVLCVRMGLEQEGSYFSS